MFFLNREDCYHQLVMSEAQQVFMQMPENIVYRRAASSKKHSQIAVLCGQTGMRPQELLDSLVDFAFSAFFLKGELK